MSYETNNNPFEQNKLKGELSLTNGNGALSVEISNIQYNESGVFILDIFKTEKLNVTVDVQGNDKSTRN